MEYAGASRPGAGGYYDGGGLQPATMDRNIHEWPGETAATLGSTSTMELLHGPSLMSEPNSGKAPKQKRNRSALSCAECRRLKLRCSREPWPCSVSSFDLLPEEDPSSYYKRTDTFLSATVQSLGTHTQTTELCQAVGLAPSTIFRTKIG